MAGPLELGHVRDAEGDGGWGTVIDSVPPVWTAGRFIYTRDEVREYFDPIGPQGLDWHSFSGIQYINSVAIVSFNISPSLSMTPTVNIGVSGANGFSIVFEFDGEPPSSTLYTFSINLSIDHGTSTGDEVNSFVTLEGTFTTGVYGASKPTNPTPADTLTGVTLLPTLSWEAGS